jgi:hypothetical protein
MCEISYQFIIFDKVHFKLLIMRAYVTNLMHKKVIDKFWGDYIPSMTYQFQNYSQYL